MRSLAITGVIVALLSGGCVDAPPARSEAGYPLRDGTSAYLEAIEAHTYAGIYLSALFDVRSLDPSYRPDVRASRLDVRPFQEGLYAIYEKAERAGYVMRWEFGNDRVNDIYGEALDRYWELLEATENPELFELSDYDNTLRNPSLISLADQLKMLPARPNGDADFSVIEQQLTAALETLRTRLVAQMNDTAVTPEGRAKLQPLKVRIGGVGFNPTVARGATEIVLSPDLLRDMFARSVFRASALFGSEMSPVDLDSFCDYCIDFEQTLPVFAYTMLKLPGVYVPSFPSEQLALGLSRIPAAALTPEEVEKVETYRQAFTCVSDPGESGFSFSFATQDDEDPCDQRANATYAVRYVGLYEPDDDSEFAGLVRALDDVARLLGKGPADGARDRGFTHYRNEMRQFVLELDAEVGDDEPGPEQQNMAYGVYFAKFFLLTQAVNMEMQKAALFLLSHEAYHAWFDATPLKQTEFDADRFAVAAYNLAYPELSMDSFVPGFTPPDNDMLVETAVDDSPEASANAFMQVIFGRGPDFVFAETYRATPYFAGSSTHPPFSERLYEVRRQIDENTGQLGMLAQERFKCLFRALSEQDAASCRNYLTPSSPP